MTPQGSPWWRSTAFQWLLVTATIAAIGWALWSRRDDLATLGSISARTILLASLATIAAYYLAGWTIRLQAARFGARMTVLDAVLVGLATSTLNYLPMKGGTILQGAVMKVRYGVRLSEFAALITGNHLMSLWAIATVGGGFMAGMGIGGALGWVFLASPTMTLAVLFFVGRTRVGRPADRGEGASSRWGRSLEIAAEGMWSLFRDLPLLVWLSALNVAILVLQAVRLWLITADLGIPLGAGGAIVVASIAFLTQRFSFVPGGLGFREGGMAAGAAAVGMPASLGLAVAVVDRAVDIAWVLVLGLPASLYLSRLPSVAQEERRPEGGPL